MKNSIFITSLLIIHCCCPGTSQVLRDGDPSDTIKVMKLICESEKYMWIGTDLGLVLRNSKTGEQLLITKEKTVLPSNKITCGVCLPDGRTYIGTTKGIAYCDNRVLFRIDSENSELPEDYIKDMMLDQKNNVWVKTIHNRVGMINGTSVTMLKRNYHNYHSQGKYFQSPFSQANTTLDSLNCASENIIR